MAVGVTKYFVLLLCDTKTQYSAVCKCKAEIDSGYDY